MRVDQFLTNYGVSYLRALSGFVADEVSPRVSVQAESGKFHVWESADDLRVDSGSLRRPGTRSTELEFRLTEGTYNAEGYAHHVVIPDRDQRQASLGGIDLEMSKTKRLALRLKAEREVRVAALAVNPNNYASTNKINVGSGTRWDQTNAKPLTDIATLQAQIYAASGVAPNYILMPWDVALKVRMNAEFRDAYKGWTDVVSFMNGEITSGGRILPPNIQGLTVIEASPVRNTAAVGASQSLSTIWGDNVVLFFKEEGGGDSDMESVNTFKTFWVPDAEISTGGVYRWFDPWTRSVVVEMEEVITEEMPAPITGGVLYDVLT